jgi:hypothetical protein
MVSTGTTVVPICTQVEGITGRTQRLSLCLRVIYLYKLRHRGSEI